VELTRHLDIPYLWIDALCIIQDESKDKMKEINNMGNIYEQATIVIAAEVSASVTEGFLFDWPASKSHPLELLLPNTLGSICIGGREYIGEQQVVPVPVLAPHVLQTRGWTFQEFALAQKALMFTDMSVRFVCNSTSEEGYDMAFDFDREDFSRTYNSRYTTYSSTTQRRVVGFDKSGEGDQKKMPDIWASIVEDYSWRIFSLWEDRLPALAGVAAKFGSIWDNTNYLAGLWRPWLIIHLCWRRHTSHSTYARGRSVPRPHILQSPTWSWSTFSCPLELDVKTKDWVPDAKLVECSVDLVSQDAPLGGVKAGTLKLLAKTISPSLIPKSARSKIKAFLDYEGHDKIYETDDVLLVLLAKRAPQGNARGLILKSDKHGKWQRVGAIHVTRTQVELWSGPEAKELELTII
jgi:hypothetical protein